MPRLFPLFALTAMLAAAAPLATAPIPDLTGWRTRLSELGEMSEQDVNTPRRDSAFPFRHDSNQTQVFNIAIGTQF
jgi:hypothetical protein